MPCNLISLLLTGEYPIIDLKDRSMPIYEKLKSGEFKKLSERAKQSEVSPNTHLADLGILSSPEEDETPHILVELINLLGTIKTVSNLMF